MKKVLFWRLFVVLALGMVFFFSMLHSAAIHTKETMSFLDQSHRQEIEDWGNTAQMLLEADQANGTTKLDAWLTDLGQTENTWTTVVRSQINVLGGAALNQRFLDGYRIGRNVDWKIHLDFPTNPIMEVTLSPSNQHFLILLPDRMRPGTYVSHAFWVFRFIIPFASLFALTIYLYRYVMKPIKRLHSATQAFSQGNYDVRIGDTVRLGKDEFSQVARTFDQMAERTSDLISHQRHLIADMSHEIRTPLTRIEMALNCAEQNIDSPQMLKRVGQETKAMRQLAEDTLTLAWLDNEKPNLRQESFDLSELIEVILEDAQFEYPEVTIENQLPEQLPLAHSNQRSLAQAIENIVRNGLRYTPSGHLFRVHHHQGEHDVSIHIIDSGPGVPDMLLGKIFTPFFKVKQKDHTRSGFGVGLALAERHIEAVQGSVKAFNHCDGGLEIVITLPLGD
ncbi:histidine kinase sensor domain-containing protein [Vibrio tapetis subsp. quintayensis]|uniref:HAMP domain-containing sensor histidine kinase n=1 Tax=Vibrio tapetis TaxID=52443 RepID=UPI0025B4C2C3|nr:histidine kinase sensor domain-containing protein [Vibrio tapetis]MDN3681970.1 histidine kinase sensor domain-containing protein [Vibrio tapetis subsp. quintayensis]